VRESGRVVEEIRAYALHGAGGAIDRASGLYAVDRLSEASL
jgi:hypothetical protein